MKAVAGRERERAAAAWVDQGMEHGHFRLRKLEVTFNLSSLHLRAPRHHCIQNVDRHWFQNTIEQSGISSRVHCEKYVISLQKMQFIQKRLTHHLRKLARQFRDEKFRINIDSNRDETN